MSMQEILIIRACAIGDFVLNLPALKALQNMHPCARFTLVGNPSTLEVARDFVLVGSIQSIEAQPWSRLFYEPVRELRFDCAIVWMKDPTVAVNLRISGIPSVFRADAFPAYGHAADHLLRTMKLERPGLPDQWLRQSDDIVVHPTSGSPRKVWPHFGSLFERLPNLVVLQGNSPLQSRRGQPRRSLGRDGLEDDTLDEHQLRASRSPSSSEEGSVRILKELPLVEVSRYLRKCRAYIGNDSGITHLAAYLGCPTVAIFGPTDPRIWGPLGRRSRVIWKRTLEDITVDEVLLALYGTYS